MVAAFRQPGEHGAHLQIVDLTKHYGDVVAANRVTLDIQPGEFITLLGPSGSGKTTTLMMIAGFVMPTSGRILVNGEDIALRSPHKRNIGMVFQNYALFPHMSVADNIGFPLKMRKWPADRIRSAIREVLALVRLEGYEGRRPRQLSGGQQQRIALARALVFRPPVLLMDEPLGALDKKLREEMQLEIKHIQEDVGITTVYVTHDQEEALTMSDRIAVMNDGRIEQVGTPTELYEKPSNTFVAGFIGESNFISGQVVTENGRRLLVGPEGLKIQPPHDVDRSTTDLETNGYLRVALRPERIATVTDGVSYDNQFEAQVQEVIYVGETTKLRVKINEEQELIIKQQNRVDSRTWQRDDRLTIGWNANDAVIVATGEDASTRPSPKADMADIGTSDGS